MNYFTCLGVLLGIVASIITIIQFCTTEKRNYWGIGAAAILIGLLCYSAYQNVMIEKKDNAIAQKENIAVHATRILEKTKFSSDQECVSAYVSFLESVREIYPDSYKRACEIEKKMDNSGYSMLYTDSTISADVVYKKLHGIVVGIAALNE